MNEFSDDYENFQEIIISYFNSLKERGEKINIPMITKIISGEYTCPTDELVREIDAERIAAINDRDSLYTRLEQLDEQLIKVEGQVRVRDYELQILHKEVLHQREIIRTYENQKLIHELSVQQHCTELVQDLSTCRGELTSYFEDRNHMTQLRADYEYMNQKFSECRRTLQVSLFIFSTNLCDNL